MKIAKILGLTALLLTTIFLCPKSPPATAFTPELSTYRPTASPAGEILFEMEDPLDDDHGLDTYMYPEDPVFASGSYDLLYFSVEEEDDSILFELTLRTLGGNPFNAPQGFSLQIIEIYINDGTGERKTPIPVASVDGADNAHVTIENAWKWALRATGWPRDHNGEFNTHGRWENDDTFDIYADGDTSKNKIYVRVPKAIVGSPSEGGPWWCTVLVGSCDNGRWRKVIPAEKSLTCIRWMPGVEPEIRKAAWDACDNKVEPRPMDILVPSWTNQKDVLSAYTVSPPSTAKVYAVGPLPAPPYFTVEVSPRSGILKLGDSIQTTVKVKSFLGFDKKVTLSASGQPKDISVCFSPEMGEGAFDSVLEVMASEKAEVGPFILTVKASEEEGKIKSCEYKVSVATELFEITDPSGDDDGPGTYEYPTNPVFQNKPGLFDITKFVYYEDEEYIYFVTTFVAERLGGNVWSGEAGFSFQLLEVYVDCMPGGETEPVTEGPRVRIDSDHPWDFAIQATGYYKPHKAERNWIAFAGQPRLWTHTILVESDLAARTVSVAIPKEVISENLGSLPEDYGWHAVILSGSQDGFSEYGSWRIVFVENTDVWQGSGADLSAFIAGVSTNVYDAIVPEGYDQHEVLMEFNPDLPPPEGYAEVPAVPLTAVGEVGPKAEPPWLWIGLGIVIAVLAGIAIAIRR